MKPIFMPSNSPNNFLDLEQEYAKLNQDLCRQLGKCIVLGLAGIIFIEVIEAFLGSRLIAMMGAFTLVSLMVLSVKVMWNSQKDYERLITILCLTVYFGALFFGSLDIGYFVDNPYGSFIFGYSVSITERQMVGVMSNLHHRLYFTTLALIIRLSLLPKISTMIYIKHIFPVILSICLDIYKEQSQKKFFYNYINSREQLSKFKDLVAHHIPEGIAIISRDLKSSLFVNDFFLNLVPASNSDIQAQLQHFKIREHLDKQSNNTSVSPFTRKTLLSFIKEGFLTPDASPQSYSCIVTSPNPKYESGDSPRNEEDAQLLFEAKISSIIWDNQPSIALVLHDITQHHTILSLKIADSQKDKILATVSHELRTPLNGMLGMIQIMEKKIIDTELLRFLNICKNSTHLLVSLVSSIVDLNQIRANKIQLNLETVDVYKLLGDIVSLFEYQCRQKGIFLRSKITSQTPCLIVTDKDRLSQVLINLIGNAHKFTSKGGITVTVSQDLSKNAVRFSVHDTGIGILHENKDKLFQVFGRVGQDEERMMNQQGAGLGLTIAETLVHALNESRRDVREIYVDSEYGMGSVFSFCINSRSTILLRQIDSVILHDIAATLPTVPNDEGDLTEKLQLYASNTLEARQSSTRILKQPALANSSDSRTSQKSSSIQSSGRSHILIVDDNLFNIAVAEHLVLSYGYAVKTALSGQDAIDTALKHNHKQDPMILILMDCQMPVINGYETTRRLKELMQSKKIPVIPIVALTANDSEADKRACRESGMCDHLSKPLKDTELERVLKKYC